MPSKPTNLARWAETSGGAPSAEILEPVSGKKDTGWADAEKPAHNYFNWWMWTIYLWIKYLDDLANQAFTWTLAHTFQKGVTVTQSTANGNAIDATGNGSGWGVRGTGGATGSGVIGQGGATSGHGVEGYAGAATSYAGVRGLGGAGGTGHGVAGSANGSTGAGVSGDGGTVGYGVQAAGSAQRSALRIVPYNGDPATLTEGDIWYDLSTHTLKLRINGSTTKTFTVS